MRYKASVCPRALDDVVMSVIFKWGCIWGYLMWTHEEQDFFVSRSKTGASLLWCTRPKCHILILWRRSDVREANCVVFLDKKVFFVEWVEASRVVSQCRVRRLGHPGTLIFSVLMRRSHAAMDFSYWSHVVQWMCVSLRKDVNFGMCWVLTWVLIELWIYVCRLILRMLCMMGGRQGLFSSDVYAKR